MRHIIFVALTLVILAGTACSSSGSKPAQKAATVPGATVQAVNARTSVTASPSPATSVPSASPPPQIATPQPASTGPIGNGCPVTFPVKGTAQKLAYSTDNLDYGTAVPVICFVSTTAAARAGYSLAPQPTPPPQPVQPAAATQPPVTNPPPAATQPPAAVRPAATRPPVATPRHPQFNPSTYNCSGYPDGPTLQGDWQVSADVQRAGVQLGLRNKNGT